MLIQLKRQVTHISKCFKKVKDKKQKLVRHVGGMKKILRMWKTPPNHDGRFASSPVAHYKPVKETGRRKNHPIEHIVKKN